MEWRVCKRCQKKILHVAGRAATHNGFCEACYETVTGNCAACNGTGAVARAHLGTMECSRCGGSGRAGKRSTATSGPAAG